MSPVAPGDFLRGLRRPAFYTRDMILRDTSHTFVLAFLTGASALVLLTVHLAESWGGLTPCVLCLYQRTPYWVAAAVGLAGLALTRRPDGVGRDTLAAIYLVLFFTFLVSIALGAYHAGVEQGAWAGPAACENVATGAATSLEDLKAALLQTPVIRCDEIAWSFHGLTLAGLNVIASTCLAGLAGARLSGMMASRG